MQDQIFNSDPIFMKSLLGKAVSIQTIDNKNHEGVIYVIDPVYKTVVLASKHCKNSLQFVLFHAIKTFNVSQEPVDTVFLQNRTSETFSNEDLKKRKTILARWLKQRLIDVKEEGELLKVDEHVKIGPPYLREDCMCENTIVLEQIQTIIDQMPQDFE